MALLSFLNPAKVISKRLPGNGKGTSDFELAILGYYTLSAHSIRRDALPNVIGKRLPRYPLIPATLLGRAVSAACRGQRLGRFFLMDALHRSWRNTTEVASVGVVVEALDDAALPSTCTTNSYRCLTTPAGSS